MAKFTEFFLDEVAGDYPVVRAPMSSASSVTRLIDGKDIYTAQEEAIRNAKETILFTTWAFDPDLPVSSPKVKGFAATWGQLLLRMAKDQSVEVGILMSDQDAVFQPVAHGQFWLRYRTLVNQANALGILPELFQVVVGRHPAGWTLDPLRQVAAGLALTNFVNAAFPAFTEAQRRIAMGNLPGLLDKLQIVKGVVSVKPGGPAWTIFPGSLHQKLIVIDEQICFVGGINHMPQNLDDQNHNMLLTEPKEWHDGCVQVEGKVVADMVATAYAMWAECHVQAKAFIAQANAQMPTGVPALPFRETSDIAQIGPVKPPGKPRIACQAWRTISRTITPANTPGTTCVDIAQGYVKAIGLASSFIYIENQYLREGSLADALIARLKAVPALNLIVVLPNVAEEAMGKTIDPVSDVGLALQFEIINRLQKAFGANLGIFSPMTRVATPRTIYVHNKVMIVDDLFATLGSANANPRSFQLDTELNLAWHDPGTVSALRRVLWREMLGPGSGADDWKPKRFAAEWTRIAIRNAKLSGPKRQGFIVPFDNNLSGSDHIGVPDWLSRADSPQDGSIV